jgi:hypothetical protein
VRRYVGRERRPSKCGTWACEGSTHVSEGGERWQKVAGGRRKKPKLDLAGVGAHFG